MRKSFVGPLITIIVLILVGAMFVYFFVQLNRTDKKLIADQTTITQDTSQVTAIVNFFNANVSQAPAATASTNTNAKTTKK